ncbi:hypothetical protein ACWGDS_34325 [Streptomyces sp. NPDC055059]|jgi:hypothetical protein|uniref:Uncharacterized protein n=1 Tax=Streptomyces sp. NBC_00119 TaxID=2975659 RepID=A0AAU1ULI6_9ACTN|nr:MULTISPECIES: hypothetical protein [unclassified Streptomyces]MCX4649542.1 hypothetical protein [Streptomyces sp. NBC_01446]MCX5321260.1 hypothetical protein [Streptomyces sp. NBC_00120]
MQAATEVKDVYGGTVTHRVVIASRTSSMSFSGSGVRDEFVHRATCMSLLREQ